MPLRSDDSSHQINVDSTSLQPFKPQCRSNPASSGSVDLHSRSNIRQKKRRGSGTPNTSAAPASPCQPSARKYRRNRSDTQASSISLHGDCSDESAPVLCKADFIRDERHHHVIASPSVSDKSFLDQNDSDSNSCIDIKTTADAAVVVGDGIGDQTSNTGSPNTGSNDDEVITSENEDETVAKLRSASSFQKQSTPESEPVEESPDFVGIPPSALPPYPIINTMVVSPRSNSCEACSHGHQQPPPLSSRSIAESPRTFREHSGQVSGGGGVHAILQNPSLSMFSSTASLVSSMLETSGPSTPQNNEEESQATTSSTNQPSTPRPQDNSEPLVDISAFGPDGIIRRVALGAAEIPEQVVKELVASLAKNTTAETDLGKPGRKRKRKRSQPGPLAIKAAKTGKGGGGEEEAGPKVDNAKSDETGLAGAPHVYPLRSRIREDKMRLEWEAARNAPRTLDQLPVEVLLRIVQYLSIQDIFRVQRVNHCLRSVALHHLRQVKRVNFSNGLPFAFLSDALDDAALRRILASTPEVTHILGFYPRRIYGSSTNPIVIRVPAPTQQPPQTRMLTLAGIIETFRYCTKLRSVEIRDVELMSQLVHRLHHVKFHGMFRNRPEGWDSEYAIEMPPEPPRPGYSTSCVTSTYFLSCAMSLFGSRRASISNNIAVRATSSTSPETLPTSATTTDLARATAAYARQAAVDGARLADRFEIVTEAPLGQGCPTTALHAHYNSQVQRLLLAAGQQAQHHQQQHQPPPLPQPHNLLGALGDQQFQPPPQQQAPVGDAAAVGPIVALAIAAAYVSPEHVLGRLRLVDLVRGVANRRGRFVAPLPPAPLPPLQQQPAAVMFENFAAGEPAVPASRNGATRTVASPLPLLTPPMPIALPLAVSNLTKLDLVSVTVTAIPKLDNIKYLHLKWVVFTSEDPFGAFQANKLQSFVMNNCIGPQQFLRYVRIFAALARAPHLSRMELVATRFVDGLVEQLVGRADPPALCFRNLQRLVMADNKDSTETDVGLLLIAGQESLTHVALQIWHSRNSLFEALSHCGVQLQRLESLVLGYQDPYQSRLTPSELAGLKLVDSPETTMPVCYINDRGLRLLFDLCPRLSNLTIRHAPYISHFPRQRGSSSSTPPSPRGGQNMPYAFGSGFTDEGGGGEEEEVAAVASEFPLGGEASGSGSAAEEAPGSTTAAERVAASASIGEADLLQSPSESDGLFRRLQYPYFFLKSLTLENCPNINVEELERTISTGDPFALFDSLVLRDMLPLRRETAFNGEHNSPTATWRHRWANKHVKETPIIDGGIARFWKSIGLLLSVADHLWTKKVGFSPLAPTGVGLGVSTREVSHMGTTGMRMPQIPVKPFDTFYTLRMHTYMSSLLQLDGSCGPQSLDRSRVRRFLLSDKFLRGTVAPSTVTRSDDDDGHEGTPMTEDVDFRSQSTQTCICGLLEFDFIQRLTASFQGRSTPYVPPPPPTTTPSSSSSARTTAWTTQQVGGHLAFHPFQPTLQHLTLYQHTTISHWARLLDSSAAFAHLKQCKEPFIRPFATSRECRVCASAVEDPPSAGQAETHRTHCPRVWIARDACVDTSELRCHLGPKPCVFTLCQPTWSKFSFLTTLHLEKVGISHLVLVCMPKLKHITLENCPALRGIIVHPLGDLWANGRDPNPFNSLRRVRIIRCPKFAIYHWLYTAAMLYPRHQENLYITYRPFGEYSREVESALWDNSQGAHVMVSHDYSQNKTERAMDESQSALDQRFREIMAFNDIVVVREMGEHVDVFDIDNPEEPLIRSEYGDDWDLSTDTFITEDTCGLLAAASRGAATASSACPGSTSIGGSQAPTDSNSVAQFYNLLNEMMHKRHKICRRGIHYHVQYRDVHVVGEGDSSTYLNYPYTESYLGSMAPGDDFNVWGDGFNESLGPYLPPHTHGAPPARTKCRFDDLDDDPCPPKRYKTSISQLNDDDDDEDENNTTCSDDL